MNDCRKCKDFVPASKGSKTSNSAPAWCLKKRVSLTSNPIWWKGCEEGEEGKRLEMKKEKAIEVLKEQKLFTPLGQACFVAVSALEKMKYFQNCKNCGCYDGNEGDCEKFGIEVDGDCDGCTFYEDRGEE